jgi:hypothetical protein
MALWEKVGLSWNPSTQKELSCDFRSDSSLHASRAYRKTLTRLKRLFAKSRQLLSRIYDLGRGPGACGGKPAIIRSGEPDFFTFGSKMPNPPVLEM